MHCDACNCPLTHLRTATGKMERHTLCARCREEESMQAQVGMLEAQAETIGIAPARKDNVLRIDQYLRMRGKRKQFLM